MRRPRLPPAISACLFDLDGVLTRTADLHAAAWKQVFDDILRARASREGTQARPFDPDADYARFVDGRPRRDGVRTFLASRGITLPEGTPADPPTAETVEGVARRKRDQVARLMARDGVAVFPGSRRFLAAARAAGLAAAVVSASENARAVLAAAGLAPDLPEVVDGAVARRLGLAGKPAPDMFLEAARQLRVPPARAAVFEDAIAGVAAGRAGRFGLVVGIDRGGRGAALRQAGADVVLSDLADLLEDG